MLMRGSGFGWVVDIRGGEVGVMQKRESPDFGFPGGGISVLSDISLWVKLTVNTLHLL